MQTYPLPTRDPFSGRELIVTRVETPDGSLRFEGRFSLGWVGLLTKDQLDFVGLLLRTRNNLQKLAADLGVAYNTARSRLDDIVEALEAGHSDAASPSWASPPSATAPPAPPAPPAPASPRGPGAQERVAILEALKAGEITYEDALSRLRGGR